ncbi:glycine--tRNA ligase subunit beta, partial [Synergistaceae bacterium OttesenSCG-928-I11]|nr:glycine--tRNA ligase subunit beta [Synergistaceae bacterium OttesenSCG-928-I11]
ARCINEIVWGFGEGGMDIDLGRLFAEGVRLLDADEAVMKKVAEFYRQRLHNQLRERGYGHGTTSLAVESMGMRPLQALRMLQAFDEVSAAAWFSSLVQSAIRVANILGKLSDEDRATIALDESKLSLEAERNLKNALDRQSDAVREAIDRLDWKAVCEALSDLSPAISDFFENVMVMDEDPTARNNRLALLTRCKALFDSIGDFSLMK